MRRRVSRRELLVGGLCLMAGTVSCSRDNPRLVVYCAHDSQLAIPVLERFSAVSGIPVAARYDTEANKSLGLVSRLSAERERPQCDVFWNNEVLGTALLSADGLLAELQPPIRSGSRGRRFWVEFGGRLRLVISGQNIDLTESAVLAALDSPDLSGITIAKPMFGTTLTQYCAWGANWGLAELKQRHQNWIRKGIRQVDGNAATKDLVAAGVCRLGFTDSDDYFAGLDAGARLRAEPVRVLGKTICIPNSAAVIAGTRHPDWAHQLVAFLGSSDVELELAKSPARQVPLGPVDRSDLPEEVLPLCDWAEESLDLEPLVAMRPQVLDWLRQEYVT